MNQNKLIKFYFYTQSGNGFVNTFRTLIEAIVLLYLAVHFTNWLLLPLMFVISVPALAVVGWYLVNFMNPVMDKISTQQGSYAVKRQLELLEGISNKLDTLCQMMKK